MEQAVSFTKLLKLAGIDMSFVASTSNLKSLMTIRLPIKRE